jgi:uncharacterized protein YprB with RNaseH-like and TPR domain
MLKNTFIHIQGIGNATEKTLWDADIHSWDDINGLEDTGLSKAKSDLIAASVEVSVKKFTSGSLGFFEAKLPSHQHYRFFREFRHSAAYIDIETTGLSTSSQITTIALYDGKKIKAYVQGKNLNDFVHDIQQYDLLITYNGRVFDIPFIESYFNIKLGQAQIDLRYVLGHLGFKGGLKKCERALGIDRNELDGVDGYFAVLLWYEYRHRDNKRALETLLAYNIEDVINLEHLMIKAYNLNIENTPFETSHKIQLPLKPDNPLKADLMTIETLRHRHY